MIDLSLADRLHQARINAGYETAKDFALAHGFKISTYTQWEKTGSMTIKACKLCAAALKVSRCWLTFGDESDPPWFKEVRTLTQEIADRAGGVGELAEALGVDYGTAKSWVRRDAIPADYWLACDRLKLATLKQLATHRAKVKP